jgi:hypothetical protein
MPSLQDHIPFHPPARLRIVHRLRRVRRSDPGPIPTLPATAPELLINKLTGSPALQAVAGAAVGATTVPAGSNALAALLTGHLLQDGELVLLILKPSRWFIILSSLRFAAVVLILMLGAALFDERIPGPASAASSAGAVLITARLMWAILHWIGRLYVLTDMRIVRLDGVFSINIFDCPLRRVANTRVFRSTRERFVRLGSIDIFADDEFNSYSTWQMVRKPQDVHDEIRAAITRAKQGGCRRP